MSSPELPVELILQIMCDCQDIASVVRLAATNRTMQAAWHNNTTFIACAVFGMTRADFEATLRLANIEASAAKYEHAGNMAWAENTSIEAILAEQDQHADMNTNENDMNLAVRRRLLWFRRSADAVTALTKVMNNKDPDSQESRLVTQSAAHFPPLDWVTASDYSQSYTKIRQLAIGYVHTQHLSAAYASIHNSSKEQISLLWIISRIFTCHFRRFGSLRLRVETPRVEDFTWWRVSGPGSTDQAQTQWRFACRVIRTELQWCQGWRPTPHCRTSFEKIHELFGADRVALMYGAYETPWDKWPRPD